MTIGEDNLDALKTHGSSSAPEGGASLLSLIPEIPSNATRILDFGCGNGSTLMRLRSERNCSELYGIEIRNEYRQTLEVALDKCWFLDLGQDDAALEDAYLDYFNYILMLDVVEHLYDPWYVLPKLAQYLAPDGILIISVPNMRHWAVWCNILRGQFVYGDGGGVMNEEHIRWFTWDTLRDLVSLSGLQIAVGRLTFPPNTDVKKMQERLKTPILDLELPPPEVDSKGPHTTIHFPETGSLNEQYPYFLANKLIMICRRGSALVSPVHTSVGVLAERRKRRDS